MNKIKELENKIIKHKNLYYLGNAEITDFEYDALEEELRNLDPGNPILNLVGLTISSEKKVEHGKKMLSLNKTYDVMELVKFSENKELISTYKIDGSSSSLIYKNGRLILGKTRGDGTFGENITPKVLSIKNIPQITSGCEDDFEVRGEVFITEDNFIELSKEMEKRNFEKPNSQRNIVAGLLSRKEDHDLCSYLTFYAFDLIQNKNNLQYEDEKFKILTKMGFDTPEYSIDKNKKDIEESIKSAMEFMSSGSFLIDGLVFTLRDLREHDVLGETSHHPRYKMAFKFQGETKKTVIEEIIWQVSRNGILTPVASVEPVELSGAKVSRVTLHNLGLVKNFFLKKGDIIEIVRSGEVIPKFLNVVNGSSENKFSYPTLCPSCREKLVEEGIRLLCKNSKCPEKIKEDILYFIQKIGIEDLSSKRLEEYISLGVIEKIEDLYKLTIEDLLKGSKIKEKLASKIFESIQKSKNIELPIFLSSLGISGGALNKCQKIVDNGFDTIDKILTLSKEDLMKIESFAEKSSEEFINSLLTKIELIKNLLNLGLTINKSKEKKDSKISFKKICITGTLNLKRAELEKLIKEHGGINVSSVTKETDYLVTNEHESNSSKFKKAKELNIKILTENEILDLMRE